jgi:hypothetical protein
MDQVSLQQGNAVTQVNRNFDALLGAALFGVREAATVGLAFAYYGGRWWNGATLANGTVSLSASANPAYIEANAAGVVSANTSGFTAGNTPLWTVTTSATGINLATLVDYRQVVAPRRYLNTTAVGNVGTGEDNLMIYTLPATSLFAGKGMRAVAWGTGANNANGKTLKFYFGTLALATVTLTVSQGDRWYIEAMIFATATDAQDYIIRWAQEGTTKQSEVAMGTATQDDGAAIVIKCTGQASADNDIVQEGMIVEFLG